MALASPLREPARAGRDEPQHFPGGFGHLYAPIGIGLVETERLPGLPDFDSEVNEACYRRRLAVTE